MTNLKTLCAGTLVLALLCLCPACGKRGGEVRQTSGGAGAGASTKPTTQAGLQFTKVTIGLPSETLDYISTQPFGLAGARPSEKVFFAVESGESATIYCRDLKSGKRSSVGQVQQLVRASLAASGDGKYLVYCRNWELGNYIDDPALTQPKLLSIAMRLDVSSGKEEEVFNFRDPQLLRFRGDGIAPFISNDGKLICAYQYDYDQSLLARHLQDWVAYHANYEAAKKDMLKPERDQRLEIMRQLTKDPRITTRLAAKNVKPSDAGEIPAAEVSAMRELAAENFSADSVLLVWQDGKTTAVPVKFPAGEEQRYHYILAAGKKTVLFGSSSTGNTYAPQKVFRCDMASGQVSEFTTIPGPTSVVQLDESEANLLALYNPLDMAKKEILPESHLLRVDLASGTPQDQKLPNDFFGYADVSEDGAQVLGQDRDDNCLYLTAVGGGKKKLVQLLGPVDGLFLSGTGSRAAYIENGVLFELEIPADPEKSKEWITASSFAKYEQPVRDYITAMGFTLPQTAEWRWEERDGMGAHEVGVELRDPAQPDRSALLRYDATAKRVVSLWFPTGYCFAADDKLKGSKLDYYGCKAIADMALERSKWLSKNAQIYQPGPNPVLDGRTNSYIITYRDGYWLGQGDDAKWVVNQEATARVGAVDGTLFEFSLISYPEVKSQPFTIDIQKAVYQIRNMGEMKIPEEAPVRFDTEHVRYAIAPKYVEGFGPAKYGADIQYRLCYEIDAYIKPEEELIMTSRVDTESGDVLGSLNFQPSNIAPVRSGG